MFNTLKNIYTFCVYALRFGHTGLSSGYTFLRNPLHCALCQIALLKYVIVIIIHFVVIGCGRSVPSWVRHYLGYTLC
jgi:hypothetical protein